MRKNRIYPFALIGFLLLSACAPFFRFGIGPQTYAVALGDLDGDGDLDAYLANGENYEVPIPNTIWLNDGQGHFSNSGYRLEDSMSVHAVLSDLDLDGNLDAVVDNFSILTVQFNHGKDGFLDSRAVRSEVQKGAGSLALAAGDLNGDGYPDIFAGGCCGWVYSGSGDPPPVEPPVDALWLSDGQGGFAQSKQTFDFYGTQAIALGDLDGDGDLDAFFGNSSSYMDQTGEMVRDQPDTAWLNDGQGHFSDSGQRVGESETSCVALGDLDGDGDLDVFAGTNTQDLVWLNAGGVQGGNSGEFIPGARLDDAELTRSVELSDLDGDGDLDALVVYRDHARIWTNNGAAGFTAGQQLTFKAQHALALGDLNGDGYVDVFAGSVKDGILTWFNDGSGNLIKQ